MSSVYCATMNNTPHIGIICLPTWIALMCDDISQAKITTKPCFDNAKCKLIMSQFLRQSRWKEYPRENNTRATKVWANVAQTRLGSEFWACDVIAHKTYSSCKEWAQDLVDEVDHMITLQEGTATTLLRNTSTPTKQIRSNILIGGKTYNTHFGGIFSIKIISYFPVSQLIVYGGPSLSHVFLASKQRSTSFSNEIINSVRISFYLVFDFLFWIVF